MKKLLLCGVLFALMFSCGSDPHGLPSEVDFSKDIKPLLNRKCMSCHGGVRQQAGLSFLFRESMLTTLETGHRAVVAGDPASSEVLHRIKSTDPDQVMPPDEERLTDREIALVEKWIDQGAKWNDHWSFVPLDTLIRPPDSEDTWIANDIDRFVLQRLKSEELMPAPTASKEVLLRRISLDVIGLPPDEVLANQYLNKGMPTEQLVDDLLASEHYGERWAAMWMDLSRYADSQGYQKDILRPTMWAFRDWVIHAFNRDLPFDEFTIQQLGGDLLPDAQDDQILATAFHRNTMTNDEGGTDDEEYRVAAVFDRVNTTYEVWQGVTMSCVQCHSHPYDPIVHDDYYNSYALFNTTTDRDYSRDQPLHSLITPAQSDYKLKLESQLSSIQGEGSIDQLKVDSITSLIAEIEPMSVPVMKEQSEEERRATHLFERGNWLVHGKEVQPAIPGFLEMSEDSMNVPDRLAFAKWLVSEKNPLTARVIVNRVWAEIFGIGIVETLEDFGTQGALPSHPELLDYLAVQLSTEWNWSIKRLVKEIVTSATYQQSSNVSESLVQRDPYNRLLARGPRFRLSAEQIRDQVLVASGLFNPTVYGPSVMPYQPEGVWNAIRHVGRWETSDDGDNYRRGLYTFWRRVSPYPSMTTFDTPSREICVSRRIRTNTPLQALVTLNDPVFVQATQQLAKIMLEEKEIESRIATGYERVLHKKPDEKILEVLSELYKSVALQYQEEVEQDSIEKLNDEEIDAQATLAIASAIFNLDEVLMKG